MRRICCLTAFLLFFAGSLEARNGKSSGRFQVSVGPVYPLAVVEGYGNFPFACLAFSYDRQIGDGGFRLGLEGALTAAPRKVLLQQTDSSFESCRTISLCLVPEFSLWAGDRMDVFVGSGIGVAHRSTFYREFDPGNVLGVCVNPCVGVVLRDRIKVTLEARLTTRLYNTVGVRIGYCF